MEETIQGTIGYVLGILGFLVTLALIIGIPSSLVFLIVGLNEKDAKKKKKNLRWAAVLGLGPVALILFILLSFALVNVLL